MAAAHPDLVALATALPGDPEEAARRLASVRDWPGLVDGAMAHGLAGVLYEAVREARVDIPERSRRALETWVELERLRQEALREAATVALAALDAAGIRAVSLKGLALGERLYGGLGVRPTTDIDLLVTDADCERAIAALEEAGWSWERGPTERYFRRHHHHVHLRAAHRPELELHFRAVVGFGAALRAEELVERSLPYRSLAGPTRVLAPEDEMLYLAVHAAGHFLSRLGWLYDIKLLARAHSELAWDLVAERAREAGLARAAAFTLDAARELGAPVPAGAIEQLGVRGKLARRTLPLTTVRFSPLAQVGVMTVSALLGDTGAASLRHVLHGTARIARRRAQRYFPSMFPAEWAG